MKLEAGTIYQRESSVNVTTAVLSCTSAFTVTSGTTEAEMTTMEINTGLEAGQYETPFLPEFMSVDVECTILPKNGTTNLYKKLEV